MIDISNSQHTLDHTTETTAFNVMLPDRSINILQAVPAFRGAEPNYVLCKKKHALCCCVYLNSLDYITQCVVPLSAGTNWLKADHAYKTQDVLECHCFYSEIVASITIQNSERTEF